MCLLQMISWMKFNRHFFWYQYFYYYCASHLLPTERDEIFKPYSFFYLNIYISGSRNLVIWNFGKSWQKWQYLMPFSFQILVHKMQQFSKIYRIITFTTHHCHPENDKIYRLAQIRKFRILNFLKRNFLALIHL